MANGVIELGQSVTWKGGCILSLRHDRWSDTFTHIRAIIIIIIIIIIISSILNLIHVQSTSLESDVESLFSLLSSLFSLLSSLFSLLSVGN